MHENTMHYNEERGVTFAHRKKSFIIILTLERDCTGSLHIRHFFTLGEHKEHVAIWPQGPKSVSLFMSEHTIHSSSVSLSWVGDVLDGVIEGSLQRINEIWYVEKFKIIQSHILRIIKF